MSNTNSPFGFRPLGFGRGGAPWSGGLAPAKVVYNYSTAALYRGDVLQFQGDGYVGRYTTGTAGSNVAGVFWGCSYLSTALGRRIQATYLPTTDHAYDIDVLMIPISGVPPQLFAVQATLTNFTIADIGVNLEPIYSGSGSAVGGNGKSGMTVTQSSATTNTLPFRVMGLYSEIAPSGANGADDASNYNIVLVQPNLYEGTGA